MMTISSAAWKRRLDDVPSQPGRRKKTSLTEAISLLGLAIRLRRYVNQTRKQNKVPYMDFFSNLDPGPVSGVPMGGIGGGTITRGWRGGFNRWGLQPGITGYDEIAANQFSAWVQVGNERPTLSVLNPDKPESGLLHGWDWKLNERQTTYYGLYPRAWTEYNGLHKDITLTCRQISPVIPHNYTDSAIPAATFVYTVQNDGLHTATVGVMLTWQNGTGGENDRAGGHFNRAFSTDEGVTGVELCHTHRQSVSGSSDEAEDPLTFVIAAQSNDDVEVTYRTRFISTSSGMDVWGDFRNSGRLENLEDERASTSGAAIAGAVCATVEVPAGESREMVFVIGWDMPLARFGGGRAYYRRYTRMFQGDDAARAIAAYALAHYPQWEAAIEAWQNPVLENEDLPDWYRAALFNELYFIASGGTVWVDAEEGEDPLPEDDMGRFAYLEGHEYLMYNTYDVHFYASWALAQLWPELERSLQRDYANAIFMEDDTSFKALGTGDWATRKVRGMIPHDLGGPIEDPWVKVNIYNIQDSSRWKDLNPKFVLQVYRDYLINQDKAFLEKTWEAVQLAIESMKQFDLDEDGLIENDGFPDQTYDVWFADGPSAYSGGLWLASLTAGAAIADVLGEEEQAQAYRDVLKQGTQSYQELLWNGEYFDYDAGGHYHSDSIMADQLAGHWYMKACGLPSYISDEQAAATLQTIYENNVMKFESGLMGAVNGMRPQGIVDTTCMQSEEVWTGTTYGLAATMLLEGLDEQAWQTARGIADMTYNDLGYWFQTPEAWDVMGNFRSITYMRPLAIWAMQWALERRGK